MDKKSNTKPATAKKRRPASSAKSNVCVMPACSATRTRGKVYCVTHAPVARERIRVAAGESAWA
ncbi:MAG: hypothetical protein JHD17_02565 [Acidimicrobiia bacterium]|nr:hypothetical protein [Acidimicrobiia bacterium]MCX6504247.1 hypothetical protein [Actinomycetota bacterium]MSO18136.1 hypothetical protein [Acidimicrobiia bacterium]MSV40897.1 hypothetical protein [Actinomycetota bacterium]MSV95184.1 hypothetical protein [Actinomycetota bacterium]